MTICVLNENKICTGCGDCDRCDLDKNKICDNCCKCLDIVENENGFVNISIADVVMDAADEFLTEYYDEDNEDDSNSDDEEDNDYLTYDEELDEI